MAYNRIDEAGDYRRVDQIRSKLRPLSHSARNYGRGGCCEHKLEEPVGVETFEVRRTHRKEELVTDELVCGGRRRSVSVRESEADRPVNYAADEAVQNVLDENIDYVLGPDSSSLEKGKATLHKHDQRAEDDEEELKIKNETLRQ